jgi:N-acetylglutamate synthase-like GNAT family acetyltransferase
MLEELYMRDLANAMRMPEEVVPAGTVTVSAPDPEMAGMDKAFVGTRLNVPASGQPTQQDREKMAIGLLDTLAGALRGAAAQVGGLPGDIRSILDMINQEGAEKYLGQRSFATTEEILADTSVRIPGTQIDVPFPPVLKEGVPNREERQKSVETAQEVGTFLPAPGVPEAVIQGGKLVGKAIKATKNMPVGMSIQDVTTKDFSTAIKNQFNGLELDLYEVSNSDKLVLSKIALPKENRKSGIGTEVMNEITNFADSKGKTIALTPSTDFGATSVSRLKEFYKRFGFVENKGKNKDFSISESMYRLPAKEDNK